MFPLYFQQTCYVFYKKKKFDYSIILFGAYIDRFESSMIFNEISK